MILRGQVADQSTGLPLPGASIMYDCSGGGTCDARGQTNSTGNFDLSVPDDPTVTLQFSYVGYKPFQITAGQLQETPLIQMTPDPQSLAEVEVVATKKSTTGWYLVAAAVGVYLLAGKKGKGKKIGGIDEELIVKVGIAAGLYFLVAKPLLQGLNILPSNQQVATSQEQQKAIDTSLAAAIQQNQPSYADAAFSGFADSIYTTITSLLFKGSTVTDILKQMNNDTDIYKLIKAYGTRQKCFAFGFGCTDQILSSAITDSLSASEIADVNGNYDSKGMTFKF